MERSAWTDERLDDLAQRMDAGFERVDSDLRELRQEVRDQGVGLRTELGGRIDSVRSDLGAQIDALRITMIRVGGGMMIGLIGVIAAVLARG